MEGVDFVRVKRSSTPDDAIPILLKDRSGLYAAKEEEKDDARDNDEDDDDEDESDSEIEDYKADIKERNDSHGRDADGEEGIRVADVTENKKRRTQHVTHGFYLVEGKMVHGMEDYLVAKKRRINGNDLGLYAIFDGHSGRDVAEYLKKHLFDNILSEPDFWTHPVSAVKWAYRRTDDEILNNVVGPRGGSTAVTAILINQIKLVVANVGDSRAVLCRNGKAEQITVDHDPQKERKLVESKEAFVTQAKGNVPRVDGQLAMTRAFGDGRLKDHITAEPDVVIEQIEEDTEFIILASDGLWKVMSNQEASDCIRGLQDGQEEAKELIKGAPGRGSKDDISCIVVMFQDHALE